ncbi:DUF983 domain-containing protein [uncultured Devosia sp.]|uniref:DUF983 domain-containing protein n=1 Tax=uncultured Devosia sp. TaxID=211434 RepID=UPI0026191607|nr:DUF983 domain-containing protein [uncultured Devosia sp.]
MDQPNPIIAGLKCRCPRCGRGKLFAGYLALAPSCAVCGLDYAFADSGDGPAVFVIFLVAPLIIILALVVGSIWTLQPWVHLLLWLPATVILSLVLLPPFKGVLIDLQYSNDAREGRQ